MNRFTGHAIMLAGLLLLAGCDQFGVGLTPVGDIKKASAGFEGKDVTVRGTASQAMKIPLIDARLYHLKDASGEIMVWTSAALPAEGEEVIVRGRVENAMILDGRGYGITFREQERKAVWIKGLGK